MNPLIRSFAGSNEDLRAAFARYQVAMGRSEATIDKYADSIGRFLETLGSESVLEVPRSAYRNFLAGLANRGLCSITIRRHTQALRAFCKFLRMSELTIHDPTLLLSQRKVPRRIPKVLTPDEMVRLIEAAKNPLERAVAQILYSTGMRVSELVKMRIEEIDFDSRIMRVVKGKGGKSRIVPFGPYAADAIRKYHEWRKPQAGWLFEFYGREPNLYLRYGKSWCAWFHLKGKRCNWRLGDIADLPTIEDARREFDRQYAKHPDYKPPRPAGPIDPRTVRYILKRMAVRAKLKGVTPHALRRALATHMLESGANIRVIQEILGHERLGTTQLYTLLSNAKIAAVYKEFHPHGR
jgi:site-specific recombinase XerD